MLSRACPVVSPISDRAGVAAFREVGSSSGQVDPRHSTQSTTGRSFSSECPSQACCGQGCGPAGRRVGRNASLVYGQERGGGQGCAVVLWLAARMHGRPGLRLEFA